MISVVSGLTIKNSYPNVTAITVIKNAKKNSNFLNPYLSINRNVNVSKTVIITPT